MPSVWIIILTWNHWQTTCRCLESLRQVDVNFELLIVDNASADKTVAQIKRHYPTAHLLQNERNLGFGAGCNVGIHYALEQGADFVLLLNNDVVVSADFLQILLSNAAQLPNAGILTPQLRHLDNDTIWFTGSRRHPILLEAADIGPVNPRKSLPVTKRTPVDYIFGTAMLIRRAVFEQIGGFDEIFFLYYEDLDLCLRTQQAGWSLFYVPEAVIYHQLSSSTEGNQSMRYYHRARSSVVFFRKWGRGWRRAFIWPYRVASGLRTALRLMRNRNIAGLRGYLRGLWAGSRLRLAPQHHATFVK